MGKFKFGIMLCLLGLAMIFGTTFSFAQEVNQPKIDTRGSLSVVGTANQNVSPDTATVVLAVETQAKTVNEAVSQNNSKANAVVSKLRGLIKPDQGETIKTSAYNVQPVYEYDQPKKTNVLTGYRVTNQVTITLKRIQLVGNIIDTAIQSGANRVNSVSFSLANNAQYCNSLITQAIDKARSQANVVANSLGVRIVGVKSVSSSCSTEGGYPRAVFAMEAKSGTGDSYIPTPIEAGEIRLNSNVNIEFYIDK